MDMRQYLKRWITLEALEHLGGTYEGQIVQAGVEELRNQFSKEHGEHPTIRFHDGWRLGLNQGMCRTLIDACGCDAEDWVGQWVQVSLEPMPRRDSEDPRPPRHQKVITILTDVPKDCSSLE